MARRSSSWTDEETKALISEWSKQERLGPRPTKQPPYVSTTASDDTAKCSTSEDVICASDGEFVKRQNAFFVYFFVYLYLHD